MTLHLFELAFFAHGLGAGRKPLRVEQFPWPSILDRGCPVIVVLENALCQVFCMADIEASRELTFQDVGMKRHKERMVGLGGLEPPTSPLSGARLGLLSPFLLVFQ